MNKKITNREAKEKFKAYFKNTVLLTYDTYLNQKNEGMHGRNDDLRVITNAVEHLYHVREHLPNELSVTKSEMCNRSADYGLLGDIANALKHKKLTKGNPRIADSEDIYEETTITTFEDKHGDYTHAETAVIAKLNDGTTRDILDILTSVINDWLIYFYEVGVYTKKPKLFPLNNPHKFVKRKDARNHDLNVTKGVQMTQRFKFQKYNPITGKVEVENLGGSELTLEVYQTFHLVIFRDTSPHGEKAMNFYIIISDEEYNEMLKFETKGQANFIKSVVEERRKRKPSIIVTNDSIEYQILLPDNEYDKFIRFRSDEKRKKFVENFLKEFDNSPIEKIVKGSF